MTNYYIKSYIFKDNVYRKQLAAKIPAGNPCRYEYIEVCLRKRSAQIMHHKSLQYYDSTNEFVSQ